MEYRESCILIQSTRGNTASNDSARWSSSKRFGRDLLGWAANFTLWPFRWQIGWGYASACCRRSSRRQMIRRHNCFRSFVLFLSSAERTGGTTYGRRCVRIVDRSQIPHSGGDSLRGETTECWRQLCKRAVVEQDPDRCISTIQEPLQVLEGNEERRRNATRLRVPPREKPAQLSCPVA
jgi:hypothetical protein